jgi:RNA polymerase sigma-70 factor (ECF subfamily)
MEEDKISDAILVLRCQKRDESAFRELVNRWEPRLYYYLRRVVESDSAVWDVLQETWLAVFQHIRRLEDPRKFPAWLYQIAHNKAVSMFRKESKYTQITDEQLSDHYENNFVFHYELEQVEAIHELLAKLKLAHREVITLYFLEGFSISEMAQIIGISEGTVKSRLYYAKHKLHEVLKGGKDV